MKLIKSSVEDVIFLDERVHPLNLIERAGRTCYKSNSAFDEETRVKFFMKLVDSSHFAMLEHANFIFEIKGLTRKYINDSVAKNSFLNYTHDFETYRSIVSGNLRAIKESNEFQLMVCLINKFPELNYYFNVDTNCEAFKEEVRNPSVILQEPNQKFFKSCTDKEFNAHFYTTFHFVCDRGVSHEMVRHRIASFAQESTRYCNYSKDKWGNEITCIKPAFFDSTWSDFEKQVYINQLKQAERAYLMLLDKGLSAQQARGVLPTDLKTEVIMTANHKEWTHFFDLRSKGTTGNPHPNMKKLADKAKFIYDKHVEELRFGCFQ